MEEMEIGEDSWKTTFNSKSPFKYHEGTAHFCSKGDSGCAGVGGPGAKPPPGTKGDTSKKKKGNKGPGGGGKGRKLRQFCNTHPDDPACAKFKKNKEEVNTATWTPT